MTARDDYDDFDPGPELGLVQLDPAPRHSPELLREAVEVTVRGGEDQIEIQLGHICNNRCVFCGSGQLTEQRIARRMDSAPVIAALEAAASKGVRRVTLLGGEPTIQPSFRPALEAAVDLGFTEIVIFTNGVRSTQPRFLAETVALGRFTWRFSIQGGNEAAHDDVTRRPGSFAKIIAGLRWLGERGQDLTANSCVNELSYRSLPDFPALLGRYGVRQLHVDLVRPNSVGARTREYLRSILPRFSDMRPYVEAMLDGFDELDPLFDVNIGNLPYCQLPAHAARVHHGGESTITVTTRGANELSRLWDKYSYQRTGMRHPPACRACGYLPHCRGVPDEYLDFYGDSELMPLPAEHAAATFAARDALRARQRAPRRPSPRGEDWAPVLRRVKRLRDASPLGGWRYGGSQQLADGVRVALRGGGGAEAGVALRRRAGGGVTVAFDGLDFEAAGARELVDLVSRALRGAAG